MRGRPRAQPEGEVGKVSGTRPAISLRLLGLVLLVALAGCAGNRPHPLVTAAAASAEPGAVIASHDIFISTTRAPSPDPAEIFAGERSDTLGFAQATITVPRDHETGRLERPTRGGHDPARHFAASAAGVYGSQADFAGKLRAELARKDGRALLFIHGYRTRFDSAIYRTAQIVHDAHYTGVPVLFTWASAGRTVDYLYDNNSATIGRDGLERTLEMLVDSGATRIDIVAHSMGTWVLMEALRQLAIKGDRQAYTRRLGNVVLASPDIDVDVFRSQMRRIGTPERPFVLLTSQDDRALRASSIIAGNRPRVGDYSDAEKLAELGVVVVNVSDLQSGDPLNHARFADNPVLVQLLGASLESDVEATLDSDIEGGVGRLLGGLGQSVGAVAQIVVTTPLQVLNIPIGR